jgi:nitrite reductase (NADH) large subunit
MPDHLVVAGNGMVGQRLVEALRDRDARRRWRVTVLSEEPRRAYDRVNLSSYFDGASPESLDLVPDGCYGTGGYELCLGEAAVAIDRAAHAVRTSQGRTLRYDALVLATGSCPFVPPVPGAGLPGCFVYRTLDDLDAIRAAALRARGDDPPASPGHEGTARPPISSGR